MANLTFLELADSLLIKAPGAPLPYLVRCLRDATTEFCEKSESFEYRFEPITSIAGEPEYEIDVPTGTRVVKLLRLTYKGDPLKPSSPSLLDQLAPKWDSEQHTPRWYFYSARLLTLAPIPPDTITHTITGAVALKPTRTASGIDEDFYEENEQALLDGALAYLFRDTAQVWGDPMLSNMHYALFTQAIEDAKSKSRHDHMPKRRSMTYGGI